MLVVPRDITVNEHTKAVTIGSSNLIKYYQSSTGVANEVLLEKNLIIFVRAGTKQISAWNRSIRIEAGQGVLVRKGAYVMTEILCQNQGQFSSVLILLDDEFIVDFAAKYRGPLAPRPARQPPDPFCQFDLTPHINAALESVAPYWAMADALPKALFDIKIHEILTSILLCSGNVRAQHWISDIGNGSAGLLKLFMEKNAGRDWSIDRFAKEYGLSLSAFKREFHQVYGTSPRAWLNSRRLTIALSMLRATQRSVTEIGMALGYADAAHFSASFKKHFGFSPSQARKANPRSQSPDGGSLAPDPRRELAS